MTLELRTAIPVHHTDTSTGAWNGPATEAAIPNTKGAATFRRMYAWENPDGSPDTKAAYRFLHHLWTSGAPGAASTVACSTGIGVLNGGRGGTTIPQADRRGVYNHLAAHLRDAKMEAPPLRADIPSIEVRNSADTWPDADLQIRAVEGGDGMTFEGYAAVFDRESLPLYDRRYGTFTEVIRRGAFKRTLGHNRDIRMFWNHNADILLGTTTAKTLSLVEDDYGLKTRARLPDTTAGRDASILLSRGDVDKMSFGFEVASAEGQSWSEDGSKRELLELSLFEVSPLSGWPAYPDTMASVRDLARFAGQAAEDLIESLIALREVEEPLDPEHYNLLLSVMNKRRGDRDQTIAPSILRARAEAAQYMLSPQDRSLSDLAAFLLADESALQAAINKLANGEPLLQQEADLLEAAIEHLEPPDADEDDMGD
jgi:Escherichia/Staphylococcus phage prohead protease